jgi:ribosomal peptide maturation radical SAM protein 1
VDVVLVSMPVTRGNLPSLGLGLLQAELRRQGFSATSLYFNLGFARWVGPSAHHWLVDQCRFTTLAGEWIFTDTLYDTSPGAAAAYVRDVWQPLLRKRGDAAETDSRRTLRFLLAAQERVGGFLEECLGEVLRRRPVLVGFTQRVASLALARRLKRATPQTAVVFGGANCEGVMGFELARQFPFIDAVVSGEGESVLPELVRRARAGADLAAGLPGVYTPANTRHQPANGGYPNTPVVRDLDALPFPDFDDYFDQARADPPGAGGKAALVMELSRGCWWGEKQHCAFCSINGATMAFLSKSAARALAEIDHLAARYPGRRFEMADNILDVKYFHDLLPALASRPSGPRLFFEVKANLRKDQLLLLRDAGVREIQPGIESLSTPVLRLMRKGVRALQNVQPLKWCRELGVAPHGSIIWGFPGEPPAEYEAMARLIPWLTHLPPPAHAEAIDLERFSPYFTAAEQYGLADVRPVPAYRHIFRFAPEVVANLATSFSYAFRQPQDVAAYTAPVAEQVRLWQAAHPTSHLFWADEEGGLLIWDRRPAAVHAYTTLTGLGRRLYLACDAIQGVGQLRRAAAEHLDREATAKEIEDVLGPLLEAGLMVRDGDALLSLALPLAEDAPPAVACGLPTNLQDVAASAGPPLTRSDA